MQTRILKTRNDAELIEERLPGGASRLVLDCKFTVKVSGSITPVYQGPDRLAAERAFDKAVRRTTYRADYSDL